MTARITYAQLRASGACRDQLALFKRKFGDSVEVTVQLAESVANEFDWDWVASKLLKAPAWDEYYRVTAAAWDEYERVTAAAWAEYYRVTAPAFAEYDRVRAAALAEYERVTAAAWAECKRVTAAARTECKRVGAAAFATAYISQVAAGDARLIAAAPELVEALRNINATFEAYGKHRLPEYVRKEFAPIRALLARIQLGDSALGIEEAGE